jgi:hypothetical protein
MGHAPIELLRFALIVQLCWARSLPQGRGIGRHQIEACAFPAETSDSSRPLLDAGCLRLSRAQQPETVANPSDGILGLT